MRHFSESDFELQGAKKKLKQNAIPTIFPEDAINSHNDAIDEDGNESEIKMLEVEDDFSDWDARQNIEVEHLKQKVESLKRINMEIIDKNKLYEKQNASQQKKIGDLEKTISTLKENIFIPLDSDKFVNVNYVSCSLI